MLRFAPGQSLEAPMRALFRAVTLCASLLAVSAGGDALASATPGDDEIAEPEDVAVDDPIDVEAPDAAEIDTPEIDTPEVDAPEVDAPEVDVDDAAAPDTPEVEAPADDSSGTGSGGDGDLLDSAEDNGGGSDGGDDSGGSGHGSGHDDGGGDDRGSRSGSHGGGDHGSNAESSGSGNSGHGSSGGSENASERGAEVVQQHLNGPIELARDDLGREYVAGEVLMAGVAADVIRATEAGYRIISEQALGPDNRVLARLLVPETISVTRAIDELRVIAPAALVTINTAYRTTQATRFAVASAPGAGRRLGQGLLGVIDTGADPAALATTEAMVASRGFGSAGYLAREHGSAVASIATRLGVRVSVADVFGPSTTGAPIASASAIAAALQWMVDAGVPVINISIEGPQNQVLERLIGEAARNGHVIVAAAGNGGPLAGPAFPGAYEGVLAITAVDRTGHPYLRANRGDYIDFAALGVDVPVRVREGYATVSGTSFASPMVAAQIAARFHRPSATEAARVIADLRQSVLDRGRPGRDPVYGWGEVRPD
ncbi:extracellular protease [alpha proteobacterium U9-1i]|nr:extracellular protease [alpha proteobacterium U9-1i]